MVQGQRERMEVGVAPVEWPRESGGGVGWGGEEAGDRQGQRGGRQGQVLQGQQGDEGLAPEGHRDLQSDILG